MRYLHKRIGLLALFSMLLVFSFPVSAQAKKVKSIKLSSTSLIMKAGEKKTLKVKVTAKKKSNVSSFPLSKGKNGKAPVITLNSGYDMPVLGLGTYSLLEEECVYSVSEALKSGFRKIDTAYIYDNDVICCELWI